MDRRVLGFIDDLPRVLRKQLLAVHEREGTLELLWAQEVPRQYREGEELDVDHEGGGDVWTINESTAIPYNFFALKKKSTGRA
jgi:hypothetical protein